MWERPRVRRAISGGCLLEQRPVVFRYVPNCGAVHVFRRMLQLSGSGATLMEFVGEGAKLKGQGTPMRGLLRRWHLGVIVAAMVLALAVLSANAIRIQRRWTCAKHMQLVADHLYEAIGSSLRMNPDAAELNGIIGRKERGLPAPRCPVSGGNYDFVFVSKHDSEWLLLILEDPMNHGGAGANALFPDAYVRFVGRAEYHTLTSLLKFMQTREWIPGSDAFRNRNDTKEVP